MSWGGGALNTALNSTLDLGAAVFRYRPSPYALVPDILPAEAYRALVAEFPPERLFEDVSSPTNGRKLLLREPALSARLSECSPVWADLVRRLCSPANLAAVDECFRRAAVDLDIEDALAGPPWALRVEVSQMFRGSFQKPHTDVPDKVFTLLVPLVSGPAWGANEGGRLLFCEPRDDAKRFNWSGRYGEMAEMRVVEAIDLVPNRGVLFPKTYDSWHAVERVIADSVARRMLSLILYRA